MINERIQQLIDVVSNGNKRAFSMLLSVNPTVIENIVGTRKGKPGYDLLEKIILSIENINIEWLFTGKGPMLKSPITVAESQTEHPAANEALIYKMYKEEREENKSLLKEIGCLEEKIRQLEADHLNDQSQDAEIVSTKKLRKNNLAATSASAQSKK